MTNSVFVTSNSDLEKCSTDLQSEKPRLFSLNLRAGESGFIFQFFPKNREFMDLIPQNHIFFGIWRRRGMKYGVSLGMVAA